MATAARNSYLALLGGTLYCCLETAWRGFTHWTMLPVGGLCFILVLAVSRRLPEETGLLLQSAAGALAVTAVELISGLILNLGLGLAVWDYSREPLNLLGQVCLPYSLLWMALCLPAIPLGSYLGGRFFGDPPRRLTLLPKRPLYAVRE